MRHLVVFSHPNPKSFNQAILKTYAQALRSAGHQVRVRDLYKIKFDPVLKAGELAGFPKGCYPKDIQREQGHIRWAQVITLICPIWWGGFTGNLRGYLDRVFSLGFAYDETAKGLLTDKKVFAINTLGAPLKVYEDAGLIRAINMTMDEIAFKFAGLNILGHKYFGSVTSCSDAERKAMLGEVAQIAKTIG